MVYLQQYACPLYLVLALFVAHEVRFEQVHLKHLDGRNEEVRLLWYTLCHIETS